MKLTTLHESELVEYIKKIGPQKWRIYSEKGKNMGTYGSREAAEERLKQIERVKHAKGIA